MLDPAVIAVMQTPEFAAALATDPVIAALEKERTNPRDDVAAIAQLLNGGYRLGELRLRPLTAADWSLWWALEVSFARFRNATERDADIALWFLSRDFSAVTGSLDQIEAKSAGSCEDAGLSWEDVAEAMERIIGDALRPLALLPPETNTVDEPRFDADWLTSVLAMVARLMQYPAHLIATERPLAEVCYYYVWARVMNDPKASARRRTPADICAAIWARTLCLAEEMKNGR